MQWWAAFHRVRLAGLLTPEPFQGEHEVPNVGVQAGVEGAPCDAPRSVTVSRVLPCRWTVVRYRSRVPQPPAASVPLDGHPVMTRGKRGGTRPQWDAQGAANERALGVADGRDDPARETPGVEVKPNPLRDGAPKGARNDVHDLDGPRLSSRN